MVLETPKILLWWMRLGSTAPVYPPAKTMKMHELSKQYHCEHDKVEIGENFVKYFMNQVNVTRAADEFEGHLGVAVFQDEAYHLEQIRN